MSLLKIILKYNSIYMYSIMTGLSTYHRLYSIQKMKKKIPGRKIHDEVVKI